MGIWHSVERLFGFAFRLLLCLVSSVVIDCFAGALQQGHSIFAQTPDRKKGVPCMLLLCSCCAVVAIVRACIV